MLWRPWRTPAGGVQPAQPADPLYPQLAPLQSWVHSPSWDRLGQPEGKFKPCICLAPLPQSDWNLENQEFVFIFGKIHTFQRKPVCSLDSSSSQTLCTWDSAHGLSVRSLTAFYKSFPGKSEASLRFTGGCSSVPPLIFGALPVLGTTGTVTQPGPTPRVDVQWPPFL